MANPRILSGKPTAPDADSEYTLAPNVAIVFMEDGSARVLDMGDSFYAVPHVGALMLQRTLQLGPKAAAEQLAAEFGTDQRRVEEDLGSFLTTLQQRGILRRRGKSVRGLRHTLAAVLAALMLKVVLGVLPSRRARAAGLLSLARWSIRICGWSATITSWKRQFPLPAGSVSPEEAGAVARAIDDAVCSAAARNPFGVACKERALCCWALARASGLPAAVVIGVELFPLSGHCWCEAGSWILSDHPDNCARYAPVLRYT